MSVFGFLSIPLRPITRIFALNNPDVEVIFTFYPWVCRIQYNTQGDKYNLQQFGAKEQEIMKDVNDYFRIATFLHYLAYYCYICDDRQRSVVVEAYKSLLSLTEKVDYDDFMHHIYSCVCMTLSKQERIAADGLFTIFNPYPYQLTTQESDSKSFGTYIFQLKRKREGFMHHLKLNCGIDMIFLPLSVGHLYRYLSEESTISKEFKNNLNRLSLELLNSLKDEKSPSRSWQANQPDNLLRNFDRENNK